MTKIVPLNEAVKQLQAFADLKCPDVVRIFGEEKDFRIQVFFNEKEFHDDVELYKSFSAFAFALGYLPYSVSHNSEVGWWFQPMEEKEAYDRLAKRCFPKNLEELKPVAKAFYDLHFGYHEII